MANLGLFLKSEQFETFAPGDVIFTEGDEGHQMYVIKEGTVEVHVAGRTLTELGPGDLVGEMALIDGGARSATVTARTACQMVPIDEKRFMFLVQQNPFFALEVMRAIVHRVREMNLKA